MVTIKFNDHREYEGFIDDLHSYFSSVEFTQDDSGLGVTLDDDWLNVTGFTESIESWRGEVHEA